MKDLEVAVTAFAGPWGPVHVAASPRGIVAVEEGRTPETLLALVRRRLGGPVVETPGARLALDRARAGIEHAIAGLPVDLATITLDLADRPEFDRRVLQAVREIPWGRTASYGEVARRIGAPRAARAVGGAVGRNPVSFLVPCHRVIAADGSLGGYGGLGPADRAAGLEQKLALLLREGVTPARRDG